MTNSPSPSVDEVAALAAKYAGMPDDAMAIRAKARGGDQMFFADVRRLAASLVSPPKAGAATLAGQEKSAAIYANTKDLALVAAICQPGTCVAVGKDVSFYIGAAPAQTGYTKLTSPLYANHEARGDGVRVTDDLKTRIFRQRRRIRTRLTEAAEKPDARWPLHDTDRDELTAINQLLADIEKSALPPLGDGSSNPGGGLS